MYLSGMNMEQIQRFLQHAHSKTTDMYILEIAKKLRDDEEDKKRDVPLVLASSVVHTF